MDDGWLIICGVLAFVILLNAGLIASAIRYQRSNPKPIFGKGLTELLNPWKDEEKALEDLHEEVQSLKGKRDDGSVG